MGKIFEMLASSRPHGRTAADRAATSASFIKIRVPWLAALLVATTVLAAPAMAQRLGLIADDETASERINVFDLDTNSVVASISLAGATIVGDTAITPDQRLGFVTDFDFQVWVVDLTASPPSLATGTNPIPISNRGEDLSITPDGRFLLASNGSNVQPISIVDIASRTEVGTFPTGIDTNSIDICDDGTSVLFTSTGDDFVGRLTLNPATGALTDTGERLILGATATPNNVTCAPGSGSGVVVTRQDTSIRSFTIPGLTPVDTRTLTEGFVLVAVFNPRGNRVYVRSDANGSTTGLVDAFSFDPATALLGATPADSVAIAPASTFFGIEQLAISSDGGALYVPEGPPVEAVNIYDAHNLTAPPLGSITDSSIVDPTGITLPGDCPAGTSPLLVCNLDVGSEWRLVRLPRRFVDPIVIAGPPTFRNRAPGVMRLRNVEDGSFEVKLQEWRYLDGPHPLENTNFLVIDKGRQRLADGSIWEAGTFNLRGNRRFRSQRFMRRFPGTPQLFLTVQSERGRTPVMVRARNVTRTGFQAALQEEERDLGTGHPREMGAYLAVFKRSRSGTVEGSAGGTPYELRRPRVNHRFRPILGNRIKLEEERSRDRERRHARERVSVMTLGPGLFAQQVTDNESDTTAIRRR